MSDAGDVRCEAGVDAGVGEIVLDRAAKRNALTPAMLGRVRDAAQRLSEDDGVGCILVRGEGAVFCAGFDLTLCRDDSEALGELLGGLSHAVRALRRARQPVVVAAHGAAIAGGCALLGGGDFVVADREAKMGYPVVTLGISPAVSAPTLRGTVGDRAMRRRLLDPALMTGVEAHDAGLVSHLVDQREQVDVVARGLAAALAAKPPGAMAATKRWVNELDPGADEAGFDSALEASLALVGSEEERSLLPRVWER